MLPVYAPGTPGEISARRKGVKQGALMFLAGAILLPILGVFNSFLHGLTFLEILMAIAAIICFVGGPLRMLYAAVFEEGAPRPQLVTSYNPPQNSRQIVSPHQAGALPPPSLNPPPSWRRPNTAELAKPPSVTENTTRLLEKDEPKNR
jgi:hypothetical protein